MLLSNLVEKSIYAGKNFKGVCMGVGLSLKSHSVKYLLCASVQAQNSAADFSVNVSAILSVDDCISLSSLRPVFPKNCVKIFIGLPIFSYEGVYLGKVRDLEIKNFVATKLFIGQNDSVPITAVAACGDAVILKKEQPYPLGQRIPAPILSLVTDKPDSVVTKPILRTAMAKGKLLKLTLSLPPFNLQLPYKMHKSQRLR